MVWVILASLAALFVANVIVALFLADAFTRARRRRVEGTPADLGLTYEEVSFQAADAMTLLGWYMQSPGARATVVLVHDADGTRSDRAHGLLALQRDYLRRGLNVLAFDLRGRGESSGMRDTFGKLELSDVAAAVEYARERAPELPIVLHGFGLGGSLAIVSAAAGLDVTLVIADSPFTSARAYLRRRWSAVPRPTFNLAISFARSRFGADAEAVMPITAVAHALTVPILFIHGEADRLVPVTHSLNIAAASLNPKNTVWRVPAAGHCTSYRRAPEAYMRRCLEFIESAIPARRFTGVAATAAVAG